MEKEQYKRKIRSNIEIFGCHISLVTSSTTPRFIYTIGLLEKYNFEFIFAGGIYYLKNDAFAIVDKIVAEVVKRNGAFFEKLDLGQLGIFSINHVDHTWSKILMLGVYDYYNLKVVHAFQIIPDKEHLTLDVPDMSRAFDINLEPVWQWEQKEWDLNVPEKSTVVTNIEVLMGTPITELARWEEDYWEMFSEPGPDVPDTRKRIVSIGTIMAIDPTIKPALVLPLEKGLIRENADDDWSDW